MFTAFFSLGRRYHATSREDKKTLCVFAFLSKLKGR